jgi:hypothetical protein
MDSAIVANTITPLNKEHAEFINSTVNSVYEIISAIPGSHHALTYLKNAYQHDPFRIALELFLVFFAIRYMLSAKYKPHDNAVKLTEKVCSSIFSSYTLFFCRLTNKYLYKII